MYAHPPEALTRLGSRERCRHGRGASAVEVSTKLPMVSTKLEVG